MALRLFFAKFGVNRIEDCGAPRCQPFPALNRTPFTVKINVKYLVRRVSYEMLFILTW